MDSRLGLELVSRVRLSICSVVKQFFCLFNIGSFLYVPTDAKSPIEETNIPTHLQNMLDILIHEENQDDSGSTGPCMEYLLHHKLLETLYTIGRADVSQHIS